MANDSGKLTRRELGRKATIAGAAIAASSLRSASASGTLPRRKLGKTGLEVSILGLGSSPLGQPFVDQAGATRIIDALLDEGVNYIDTAPIYGLSEIRLGKSLKGRRDKFVLVSKVEATSSQDATWQVGESLRKLQTDYFDLVHIHNVGRTDRFPDLDVLTGELGALQGLRDLKKKGKIRHIGVTCHLRPKRTLPIMETGDIEAVMCAANFVDRHTYNFEGTVFTEAKKRGMGIVAMKVLGGRVKEDKGKLSDHYDDAVRYALGIPGLSVAIMGMKNAAEVRQAAAAFRAYRPFSDHEISELTRKGKEMANDWGELRGPVAWEA